MPTTIDSNNPRLSSSVDGVAITGAVTPPANSPLPDKASQIGSKSYPSLKIPAEPPIDRAVSCPNLMQGSGDELAATGAKTPPARSPSPPVKSPISASSAPTSPIGSSSPTKGSPLPLEFLHKNGITINLRGGSIRTLEGLSAFHVPTKQRQKSQTPVRSGPPVLKPERMIKRFRTERPSTPPPSLPAAPSHAEQTITPPPSPRAVQYSPINLLTPRFDDIFGITHGITHNVHGIRLVVPAPAAAVRRLVTPVSPSYALFSPMLNVLNAIPEVTSSPLPPRRLVSPTQRLANKTHLDRQEHQQPIPKTFHVALGSKPVRRSLIKRFFAIDIRSENTLPSNFNETRITSLITAKPSSSEPIIFSRPLFMDITRRTIIPANNQTVLKRTAVITTTTVTTTTVETTTATNVREDGMAPSFRSHCMSKEEHEQLLQQAANSPKPAGWY